MGPWGAEFIFRVNIHLDPTPETHEHLAELVPQHGYDGFTIHAALFQMDIYYNLVIYFGNNCMFISAV